jgi:hypothetical protein
MVFRREAAAPHTHHLALVEDVAEDIRRNLVRLGMMRGLTTVRVSASGAYRITMTPAESVRANSLMDLGISLPAAVDVLDDVLTYDPTTEAAVMVLESNPIDGTLITFLVQSLFS